MKRSSLVASLLLAACGGGDLNLSLTSDDVGARALGLGAPADLTTVRSLTLTVDEIWVHVADADPSAEAKGEEGVAGWRRVTDVDQSLDLMTVRNSATLSLGDFPLPEGKLTQVRLRLKPAGAVTEARARLPGTVLEQDGTACDLSVPSSVFDPGLKLSGAFQAMRIEAGGNHRALLNLNIKDSAKLAGAPCVYTLDPVLEVKRFESGSGGGGDPR